MRKYSLLFFALITCAMVFAQKPVIVFDTNSHDFGKINEEDGKATFVFNFTNKGNAPMVINRVQASCGCTTPTYTKEPIEPGKKGNITVTYNPLGRPGAFTKTITVYSNSTEEAVNLTIRGEVIPRAGADNNATPINDMPVVMGDIRLRTKLVQMNNIEKGKTQIRTLDIRNSGNNAIRPAIENLPAYITATVTPEVIKPKEEGKINFTFNSKACNQWGPINDEVYVVLNGQRKYSDEFQLRIFTNIIEDFSKMTLDQKRKAPILELSGRTVDFGVIKSGTKKASKLRINNKGINPLEIRRIVNNNNEIAVNQPRITVAGGKHGFLVFTVNSKNLPEGDYKKTVTIQTNDPDNSFIILVMNWKVQR